MAARRTAHICCHSVTLLVIMPTNKILLDPGVDKTSPTTRAILEKWERLHGVRSILSLMASSIFLLLLLRA